MKSFISGRISGKKEALLSLILLSVVILPFFTFAKHRKDVYVEAGASSSGANGSSAHPYTSISDALDHADDDTDVHVAKGTYREKITIPDGVRVFGADREDVVIDPDGHSGATVTMKDDTEINKVTIKGQENGILVKDHTEASIVECSIEDSEKDGIKIESGKISDSQKVSITDSMIEDSGRSGIYAKKRRLVIINSEIRGSEKDGIDIAAGSRVWMEGNKINDNNGVGIKVVMDGSEIWTKKNTIRDNHKDGFEVNSYGANGRVDIKKAKITGNGRFAIARNMRSAGPSSVWKGLTVDDEKSTFSGNKSGTISPVARLY